jgi:hypothetical protein
LRRYTTAVIGGGQRGFQKSDANSRRNERQHRNESARERPQPFRLDAIDSELRFSEELKSSVVADRRAVEA